MRLTETTAELGRSSGQTANVGERHNLKNARRALRWTYHPCRVTTAAACFWNAARRGRNCVAASLTALDYSLLLLDFDCAGGGRPTFFAGIGQVAQVRIV